MMQFIKLACILLLLNPIYSSEAPKLKIVDEAPKDGKYVEMKLCQDDKCDKPLAEPKQFYVNMKDVTPETLANICIYGNKMQFGATKMENGACINQEQINAALDGIGTEADALDNYKTAKGINDAVFATISWKGVCETAVFSTTQPETGKFLELHFYKDDKCENSDEKPIYFDMKTTEEKKIEDICVEGFELNFKKKDNKDADKMQNGNCISTAKITESLIGISGQKEDFVKKYLEAEKAANGNNDIYATIAWKGVCDKPAGGKYVELQLFKENKCTQKVRSQIILDMKALTEEKIKDICVDQSKLEMKASDEKPDENKPDENKPAENKPDENKPDENKPAKATQIENGQCISEEEVTTSLKVLASPDQALVTTRFNVAKVENKNEKVYAKFNWKGFCEKHANSSTKKSFPIWAIVLIALGGCALIGGIAYCVCTKSN